MSATRRRAGAFRMFATAPGRPSPYTALRAREIKAFSDTQIAQYRAGEGMGFALAGELNHYPGPRHTLELADSLALTADQRSRRGRARRAHRRPGAAL